MKIIIVLFIAATLTGCAAVEKISSIWPRDHDPALVSGWVTLDTALDKANCEDKETIVPAITAADWLDRYANFRDDPQKGSTKLIKDNLNKAQLTQNKAVCERYVKISVINMKTIKNSWSGR